MHATKPTGTVVLSLTNPSPSYGDHIYFDVVSDDPDLFVHLIVTQNGQKVAEGFSRWFVDSGSPACGPFGLYSPIWTGGAAQAEARLEDFSNYAKRGEKGVVVLDTTTFAVAA